MELLGNIWKYSVLHFTIITFLLEISVKLLEILIIQSGNVAIPHRQLLQWFCPRSERDNFTRSPSALRRISGTPRPLILFANFKYSEAWGFHTFAARVPFAQPDGFRCTQRNFDIHSAFFSRDSLFWAWNLKKWIPTLSYGPRFGWRNVIVGYEVRRNHSTRWNINFIDLFFFKWYS